MTDGPDMFWMEIGHRDDLSKRQARSAAKAWRKAVQRHPRAEFLFSLSGYDDDPRGLWEIPEAARFVSWWARLAGMDDFATASRIFGASSPDNLSLGTLALCGVFGDEIKQQVTLIFE